MNTESDIAARPILEAAPPEMRDGFALSLPDTVATHYLDIVPLPIFGKDASGRYTVANQAFLDFLGVSKDRILGKTVYELSPWDLADTYHAKDLELMKSGGKQVYAAQVSRSNGDMRDVIFHKAIVRSSDGQIDGIIGAIQDVTDLHDFERELAERNFALSERLKELRCLYEVGRILADGTLSIGAALVKIAHLLPESLQFPNLAAAEIVVDGDTFQAGDLSQRAYSLQEEILVEGKAVGTVSVSYAVLPSGSDVVPFLEEESPLVAEVARQIGKRIENSRDDQALRESEDRFRATFEQAAVGICHVSPEGRILRINDRLCQIWGYNREEIQQLTFQDITVEEDLAVDLELVGEVLNGERETYTLDKRYRRGDGEVIWGRLTVSLVRHPDGTPNHFISVVQDITDAKNAERKVAELTRRLSTSLHGTISILSRIQEQQDPYTAGHQSRVTELATAIGRFLKLDEVSMQDLEMGAMIHDIGKVQIPTSLLTKPGRLTAIEYEMIKTHTTAGYETICDTEIPAAVANIVRYHHERWDGSGYPEGLKGTDIPVEARIVAVADVIESIASHRPYRPARGIDTAIEEVRRGRGELYDPEVVDACLEVLDPVAEAWDLSRPANQEQ